MSRFEVFQHHVKLTDERECRESNGVVEVRDRPRWSIEVHLEEKPANSDNAINIVLRVAVAVPRVVELVAKILAFVP